MKLSDFFADEIDEALTPWGRGMTGAALAGLAGMSMMHDKGRVPAPQPHAATAQTGETDGPLTFSVRSKKPGGMDRDALAKAMAKAGGESGVEAPTHTAPAATAEDKKRFVQTMLPAIRKANQDVVQQRRRVQLIAKKAHPSEEEQGFLDALMKRYRVASGDVDDLIARLNPVPASLALAQSAVESGWGLSRLAQAGSVYFGQKTTNSKSVDALEDGTKYAGFEGPEAAAQSYIHNLNSHPAYRKFRQMRYALAKEGKPITGETLAPYLASYSTRGGDYTKQLAGMIKKQGFDRFDNL